MMIDQDLLRRVIAQESGGDPNALSAKGAAGIMQIMPDTARQPGYGVTPLQGWDGKDPRTAPVEEQIRFGTDYLNAMKQANGGDTRLALAAYNAGPGAVQAAGGQVPNFKETQDYVNKLAPTSQGIQVAQNGDWRSRAEPITLEAPAAAPGDWRSRAEPIALEAAAVEAPGRNLGAGAARVQGFNSAVPFGERIAAGIGAVGAKAFDSVSGNGVTEGQSISELYREGRDTQAKTAENNQGAYVTGALAGAAATLPLISAKVLTGARATTGARGAVNAVPEALGAVGNYVRGATVATTASRGAKIANVGGKAVRAATVSAPAGAVYGYGNSRNDLDSKAAVDDAKSNATISAALGATLPIAGAALKGVPKPNIPQGIKDLASVAKSKFDIDLSLDQIAPSKVRDTVQKVSQNLPGSGVDSFQAKQEAQWMRAIAKTLGEDADNLQPEVIKNYLNRASDDFTKPLQGKTIKFSQKDINSFADITANAGKKVSSDLAKVVQNNVDDVLKNLSQFKVGNGGIREVPGERLASLRSQLVQDLPSIDGGARQQVAKIIDKIDEVIDTHLSPEEMKQLSNARLQWRNFRTLEPLLEKSPDGTINPTQLMQKVASSKYIKAARKTIGEDDLVDLAKIGKQFLPKKGGSDTAQKLLYIQATGLGGSTAVGVAAPLTTGATLLANRGYQKLLNQSPKVVSRLVNDTASKSNAVPASALLGANVVDKITKK